MQTIAKYANKQTSKPINIDGNNKFNAVYCSALQNWMGQASIYNNLLKSP